jgi:hypothetical protein
MAAAKGMLPLTSDEMLEVLVVLISDENEEVRSAAAGTLDTIDPGLFSGLAADEKSHPDVLGFLCTWPRLPRELAEAVIFNPVTPDGALAQLASRSNIPSVIEAISLKQQSLIRSPEIIDAILFNPARSPEAERRAREVHQEFFEKQFGVRLVAEEQRVQAEEAAARTVFTIEGIEDLVRLGLIEEGIDDSIVAEYEAEVGPLDTTPPAPEQALNIERVFTEIEFEDGNVPPERLPIFQQIALMSVKDRVMLAIKGTREARLILVRDPNRLVSAAVLKNPRITDTEIENISSIKTVPEDVLRQIGQNRAWTRSYVVIHNLIRNPRTPIAISLTFLNRIQTRDLRALSTNKNIPDVIRTTASRVYIKRSAGAG